MYNAQSTRKQLETAMDQIRRCPFTAEGIKKIGDIVIANGYEMYYELESDLHSFEDYQAKPDGQDVHW